MSQTTMLLINMLLASIAKKCGGELFISKEDQKGVTPADLQTEQTPDGLKIKYIPNRERLEGELKDLEAQIAARREVIAALDAPPETMTEGQKDMAMEILEQETPVTSEQIEAFEALAEQPKEDAINA